MSTKAMTLNASFKFGYGKWLQIHCNQRLHKDGDKAMGAIFEYTNTEVSIGQKRACVQLSCGLECAIESILHC